MFPARDYVTGHRFTIARCTNGGLAVPPPQPAGEAMGQYYPAEYYGTSNERRFPWLVEQLQNALYAHRVRLVESATSSTCGRVLDVGCGRGLLLRVFRNRAWQVQGTELSAQAARYAREVVKIPVEIGRLETIGFADNSFDAVTMWHVLEHIPDPRVLMLEVRRILKPGGVFLVGVPNFGGWEARFCRDKWFHLDVPRHVTHLTKATLHEALRLTGFEERRWLGFAPEYDAFSFVQSALNRLGLQHNLLYNLLRGKGAKVLGGAHTPFWQIPLTLLLAAPLGILSLPATTIAGLCGQAGTTTVLAVKPLSTPAS
jgi:2-polyprenyl-3-methyl-5-hydroxy-6-metoxy-1,4-benzoquinol methylase